MNTNEEKKEKVLLLGVHTGRLDYLNDTTEESMKELAELAKTAGAEVVGDVVQNKSDIENATYMGEGKLLEIKNIIPERMKVKLEIIDSGKLECTASPLGYFITDKEHIDSWTYSPSCCEKVTKSIF